MLSFINYFRVKARVMVLLWTVAVISSLTPLNAQTLQQLIAARKQLAGIPTVYLTVPAAIGKNINDVVNKTNGVAEYYDAMIQVVDDSPEGSPNHLENFYDDKLQIKCRGNETAQGNKKPYRLKFAKDEKDAAGNVTKSHKHDLIGHGYKKRNWTLLTNERDPSYMHNALAYHLGQMVGLPFCPGYKFVDLVINDTYIGCYQFSDHCEVGSNRIEVDETTGWYLELNKGGQEEEPCVNSGSLIASIKNPEPANTTETAQLKAEVLDYFKNLHALFRPGSDLTGDGAFISPITGWRTMIDEETLLKYYLAANISGNHDGFMTVKVYRDVNDKLHFGPIWDHDTAFGIYDDGTTLSENAQNGTIFTNYAQQIAKYDPYFVKRIYEEWKKLTDAGCTQTIQGYINDIAAILMQSYEMTLPFKEANFTKGLKELRDYIDAHNKWLTTTYKEMYIAKGGDKIEIPEDTEPGIGVKYNTGIKISDWNAKRIPGGLVNSTATSATIVIEGATSIVFSTSSNTNDNSAIIKDYGWTDANKAGVSFEFTDELFELLKQGSIYVKCDQNDGINIYIINHSSGTVPNAHHQLTNLPTIYLKADAIGSSWAAASIECYDSKNKLTQGTEWTNEALEVQYQGSGKENSKNSYRIKFGTETKLLASGAYKQWVLLANDDDPSLMRNALAKKIGDQLGLPFTPGYQFVDLYVNDVYMGTYQVTDRVKAEEGRALVLNGKKKKDWHVRFNSLGEIQEDGLSADEYVEGTDNMPYIIPKNPDPDEMYDADKATLLSTMKDYFEKAFAVDDEGHYLNLASYVDQQQLIAWYVAQEILCIYKGFDSVEAYRSVTSTAADQKLHMAILWDNEKSLGNSGKHPVEMTDLETLYSYKSLMLKHADYKMMKRMFRDLWQQPWFAEGVLSLWKSKQASLLSDLTSLTNSLQQELSQSQAKDVTLWPSNDDKGDSYADKVGAIRTYLNKRFEYLTVKFTALARPGDLNDDGKVDKLDVPLLASILLGKSSDSYGRGDVNGDGKLSLEDLTALIEKVK